NFILYIVLSSNTLNSEDVSIYYQYRYEFSIAKVLLIHPLENMLNQV
ncbi:1380_t:CDS:1, partial [Racocetra persica]